MKYLTPIILVLLTVAVALFLFMVFTGKRHVSAPTEQNENQLCHTFIKHSPPYKALRCKE